MSIKNYRISYKQYYLNEKEQKDNIKLELDYYKKEVEILKNILKQKNEELDNYKKQVLNKDNDFKNEQLIKGYMCSISGNEYEKRIYNYIDNFCTNLFS